jgi:hypothetical protein
VYAPDPDADIQVAEGCNICNAEIGWCIEHTGCPGVPTDGS